MTNNELVTQACLAATPTTPPTSQENGSKKYFKSQAENWKMSCLSVWIKVYVSVSLVFFDNIAQVLSSDFNGLKTRQPFQIKLLEIQENIDLNECQSPVNWELVNIKYLVFLAKVSPAPAALPARSQPQWRPREHNWDRPPPKAI